MVRSESEQLVIQVIRQNENAWINELANGRLLSLCQLTLNQVIWVNGDMVGPSVTSW